MRFGNKVGGGTKRDSMGVPGSIEREEKYIYTRDSVVRVDDTI